MSSDQNTKTETNLYTAFVGEAKACLRLLGFAERADQEGYPQIAKLFRAISAAERVHALRHLRHLKLIQSTEENLAASFESETKVSEDIYPAFIREAEEDGNDPARLSFTHARDAETFHGKLYKGAMDHLMAETEAPYYVCRVCGYVAEAQPPEECPVCGAKEKAFFQVD